MDQLRINSVNNKQIIDITEMVDDYLRDTKVLEGTCHIFVLHTTCAITTADLDPGTDQDMLDAFEEMIPRLNYRHPHDPEHVPDHILSSLIGTSILVPVKHGRLLLGTWQRLVFVELNGPQERKLSVNMV